MSFVYYPILLLFIYLFISDPVDSTHLGTCDSISQVIEQLPQPNRTSRYSNYCLKELISIYYPIKSYLYLQTHSKDEEIHHVSVN